MEHIGIDVHKRESQVCIIDGTLGEVTEKRIRTERGRFKEVLGGRGRAKVLLEGSTESEWVARCLEELGHEVVFGIAGIRTQADGFDDLDPRRSPLDPRYRPEGDADASRNRRATSMTFPSGTSSEVRARSSIAESARRATSCADCRSTGCLCQKDGSTRNTF